MVKCPRCGNLLEADAGQVTVCRECGFQARAPDPPAPGTPRATPPAPATAAPEAKAFAGPLAFLAGLAGLGTFYLAPFLFPLVLSLLGIVGGIVAMRTGGKDLRGIGGIVMGAVGLLLGVLVLAL